MTQTGMFGRLGMFRILVYVLGELISCVELKLSDFDVWLLFTKKNQMGWMCDMPSCCRVELLVGLLTKEQLDCLRYGVFFRG